MTNRLQELRMERKETQQQMAAVLGLKTISAYCKKELGYNSITLEEAHAAAVHFGTSIEAIFFADDDSESESIAYDNQSLPPGRREIYA